MSKRFLKNLLLRLQFLAMPHSVQPRARSVNSASRILWISDSAQPETAVVAQKERSKLNLETSTKYKRLDRKRGHRARPLLRRRTRKLTRPGATRAVRSDPVHISVPKKNTYRKIMLDVSLRVATETTSRERFGIDQGTSG